MRTAVAHAFFHQRLLAYKLTQIHQTDRAVSLEVSADIIDTAVVSADASVVEEASLLLKPEEHGKHVRYTHIHFKMKRSV